jgi:hypothetical protein
MIPAKTEPHGSPESKPQESGEDYNPLRFATRQGTTEKLWKYVYKRDTLQEFALLANEVCKFLRLSRAQRKKVSSQKRDSTLNYSSSTSTSFC